MSGYPESVRKRIVQRYQEQWQETGLSIDDYCAQAKIHHTTMRKWLKQYAPEFDVRRKSEKKSMQRSVISSTGNKVQVETEWYEHEQQELTMPDTAHIASESSPAPDLIDQLREEIEFLKRQIIYWMKQEPLV